MAGAAALLPSIPAHAHSGRKVTSMDELTADEIRELLKLEPNATCGFVRVTFPSKQSIVPGGLAAPFADGRPLGSALYFMVKPHRRAGAASPHPQRPALSLLSR